MLWRSSMMQLAPSLLGVAPSIHAPCLALAARSAAAPTQFNFSPHAEESHSMRAWISFQLISDEEESEARDPNSSLMDSEKYLLNICSCLYHRWH